jgi:hypothetical protein
MNCKFSVGGGGGGGGGGFWQKIVIVSKRKVLYTKFRKNSLCNTAVGTCLIRGRANPKLTLHFGF